jgi:sulfate-transporting ATPase
MTIFLQFVLLGLGLGAAYALLAQGLTVIQTGSGVINFAHGAFAMIGAFAYFELHQQRNWSTAAAFAASVFLVVALGIVTYQVILRPLRNASNLARVIASLGVLLTLEAAAELIWGIQGRVINPILPAQVINLPFGLYIGTDRLIMLGIALGLTIALWLMYRFSLVGLAIRAGAENERAAATLGWSPNALATLTWGVGAGLAGVAGILIAAITALQVDDMTFLVIPTLAAALAGGFASFPLTFLAALVIGIGQSLMANYITLTGASTALPFAVIILFLVVRGKSLPARDSGISARLPKLGTGRVSWPLLITTVTLFLLLSFFVFPVNLVDALSTSLAWGIVLLSVVVLMGFAGQVDLAPLAWGGVAAVIAARLVADVGIPFEVAILIGALGAIPVGLAFGVPALRARGLNLAVVTLGLGVMIHAMVLANDNLTGGFYGEGKQVGAQKFFGIDVGALAHPARYLALVLGFFVFFALIVASVRRGRMGRRLIAVRTNERAAAALGISVLGSKLYAFALSASIAAVGGILLGFHFETVLFYETYSPTASLLAAAHAVIGGVGYVLGPVLGSQFAQGGFGAWIMNEIFPGADPIYLSLIAGVVVILLLIQDPDGLVSFNLKILRLHKQQAIRAYRKVRSASRRLRGLPPATARPSGQQARAPLPEIAHDLIEIRPRTLELVDVTIRYGGITAVDGVSLTVRPGEVVGLIGPNGAGKTSLVDAITGFVRQASGEIRLDGTSVGAWSVHRRARAGICRSFQTLELFESNTVEENLRVAADPRDARAYVTDLFAPGRALLSPLTVLTIKELGLEPYLDLQADELPYGIRRLTGIARTIVVGPSVLLLDEPAAGLGERETVELRHVVRRLADEWGLGILIIEHDMSLVMALCDRLEVLDFGRQIASGVPEEIRRNPAVIAAYLGDPDSEASSAKVGS